MTEMVLDNEPTWLREMVAVTRSDGDKNPLALGEFESLGYGVDVVEGVPAFDDDVLTDAD